MGCCCGSGACTPPRYSLQTLVSPCSYPVRVHKPLSLLSDLLGSTALVDLSKWSGPLSLHEVAERPQHPLRQGGGRRTGQSADTHPGTEGGRGAAAGGWETLRSVGRRPSGSGEDVPVSSAPDLPREGSRGA